MVRSTSPSHQMNINIGRKKLDVNFGKNGMLISHSLSALVSSGWIDISHLLKNQLSK